MSADIPKLYPLGTVTRTDNRPSMWWWLVVDHHANCALVRHIHGGDRLHTELCGIYTEHDNLIVPPDEWPDFVCAAVAQWHMAGEV